MDEYFGNKKSAQKQTPTTGPTPTPPTRPTPTPPTGQIPKLSNGYKVSSPGAALVILCFFMPWLFVSCSGQTAEISGLELASGATINFGFTAQQLDGQPILFLVLLAAFGVLALAYFAFKRGSLTQNMDGYGVVALGAVPLLIMFSQFSGFKSQAAQQGIYVEYQFGLWGVVIGYIAVIAGGVLNLRE